MKNLKTVLALLMALTFLCTATVVLAHEPVEAGDDTVGVTYGATSGEFDFDTNEPIMGASWAHWWTDNLTTEVDVQRGRNAREYLGHMDLAYHWGPVFFPVGVSYVENDPGVKANAGVGVNLFAGAVNVSLQARYMFALDEPDEGSRGNMIAFTGIRWRF